MQLRAPNLIAQHAQQRLHPLDLCEMLNMDLQ
jgi:hypothetical protein